MPDVLLLCEYASLNGGERSMLATLDGVVGAGFSISSVAPPTGSLADAFRARGINVLPLSAFDPTGNRLPQERLRD